MTVDAAGRIYIAGIAGAGLPVTPNAFQPDFPAYFVGRLTGFLMELDPTGSQVLYGTYLAGLNPRQLAVDNAGYIYVLADHPEPDLTGATATTLSYPAPITPNAAQSTPGIGSTPTVVKIAPTGELIYATFVGGAITLLDGNLAMRDGQLVIDPNGSAVVCGTTADPKLPVTPDAFQRQKGDSYNVFVAKLSSDGTAYQALSYLGGDGIDLCGGMQLDAGGNIYVFGSTSSRYFPVTPGAFQTTRGAGWNLFAAKLDPLMQTLIWSTYVGGDWDTLAFPLGLTGYSNIQALAVAADGSLAFVGTTQAEDYPVSPDTGPPPYPGSQSPVFGVLDPSGSRLTFSYALPFPGWLTSIMTGDGSSFLLIGAASVSDIAANATLNAQGMDGFSAMGSTYSFLDFVAKIDLPSRSLTYLGPLRDLNGLNAVLQTCNRVSPDGGLLLDDGAVLFELNLAAAEKQPLIAAVVNPASLLTSPLTPGQVIEVRGKGLGPADPVAASDVSNPPIELAGTQLTIDSAAVPLLSVRDGSITAVAPAGGFSSGTSIISVTSGGAAGDPRTVSTAAVNPAVFTALDTGVGQAVAFNEDGSANSALNPAQKQHRVRLMATGLGTTSVASDGSQRPDAAITATVNGVPADVAMAAVVAGYAPGYFAVDVIVPGGAPESDFVLVQIAANGQSSQPGVTISIR